MPLATDNLQFCRELDPGLPVTNDVAMLVLSRKKDESIIINDNIVVTIVDIKGDKVRLGFQAPKEITIHRKEVAEAIKRSEGSKGAPTEGKESGK